MFKKELVPGVFLYRNDLFDHEEVLKELGTDTFNQFFWEAWDDHAMKKHFDNPRVYNFTINDEKANSLINSILDFYDMCFSDYLQNQDNHKFLPPYIEHAYPHKNWKNYSINMFKVFPAEENLEYIPDVALNYHIDANPNSIGIESGERRTITANLYLNDDYENGEIIFLYGNDVSSMNNKDNLKLLKYKPKAGDVLVYPSAYPFAHATTFAVGNNRYLLNCMLDWNYDGHLGNSMNEYIIRDSDNEGKSIEDDSTYKYLFKDWALLVKEADKFYLDGKDV